MTTSESADGFAEIPLEAIREPAHQLREKIDADSLGRLADSIAAEGLHQPIGVRGPDVDGQYEIVWGHRRFLAVRLLRRRTITARRFPADFDPLLAAVTENLNRENLNPLEEALAVRAFLTRGHSRADIARLFRRSYTWVEQRTLLLDLPTDLQDAIRNNGLPISVAHALRDVDHEPYRKQLVYEAVTHGATAAVANVWRQHYLADRERLVRNTTSVNEFIRERNSYVLKYPCDWCDEERPYAETRTIRLCLSCCEQLEQAKAGARSA